MLQVPQDRGCTRCEARGLCGQTAQGSVGSRLCASGRMAGLGKGLGAARQAWAAWAEGRGLLAAGCFSVERVSQLPETRLQLRADWPLTAEGLAAGGDGRNGPSRGFMLGLVSSLLQGGVGWG